MTHRCGQGTESSSHCATHAVRHDWQVVAPTLFATCYCAAEPSKTDIDQLRSLTIDGASHVQSTACVWSDARHSLQTGRGWSSSLLVVTTLLLWTLLPMTQAIICSACRSVIWPLATDFGTWHRKHQCLWVMALLAQCRVRYLRTLPGKLLFVDARPTGRVPNKVKVIVSRVSKWKKLK